MSFTLAVDVPSGQAWTVDLTSLARGALVTFDDYSGSGSAFATIEGAIAPFNVTIGANAFSFTAPGWTTDITTGQIPTSSCIGFEGTRSDSSVASGTGPGTFTVQMVSALRTYSSRNESAVLFGIDDVLPVQTNASYLDPTSAHNYADNLAPSCSGRPVADDGYQLNMSLHIRPCSDGIDNDGDGSIDFPADAGCTSAADETETGACGNGIDDDGDGTIDFGNSASNDFGCNSVSDLTERNESFQCDDAQDNDGDSLVDLADPDCASFSDTK